MISRLAAQVRGGGLPRLAIAPEMVQDEESNTRHGGVKGACRPVGGDWEPARICVIIR